MVSIAKEKRTLELLNESLLSDEIKDILKKNIKKYPDDILDGILESLSRESVVLETLSYELMWLDSESGKRWDELAKKQIDESDKFVEDAFQKMVSSS